MNRIGRTISFRWGRARRSAYFRLSGFRRRSRDYLFVCGPEGDARRYRCDHQAEQLRSVGRSVDVGYHAELDLPLLVKRYGAFVLYRVPWDERAAGLVAAARSRSRPVVADVDDLVFDVSRAHEIRALAALPAAERRAYVDGIERLARTLAAVDGVVVSTDPLREAARALNPRVEAAYNVVSRSMVEASSRARDLRASDRDGVVIAYLSGTPTHERDFSEAADAVVRTLEDIPQARFWAVGHLTVDGRFDRFRDRVEHIPSLPFRKLPQLLARVDVNLAPLESGNSFTNAKSCLKYLEAALVGVATVASPRADLARVIRGGDNGLLADDPDAWAQALAELVSSDRLRAEIGSRAYADVRAAHTTEARARRTAAAFEALTSESAGR